jgi:hypothetical protein
MLMRRTSMSLFDRLRRATLPRVLLLVATLMASQSSLACAYESLLQAPGSESAAAAEALPESSDCCELCPDCASCGVCHASAAGLRSAGSQADTLVIVFAKLNFATAAPALWAPPTLLRPPIDAA